MMGISGIHFKPTNTLNFMVRPCINNIQHFNYQLTHIMLKNVELLKHSKISKAAPTCFGLQEDHLQGAKVSISLKLTHLVKRKYVEDVQYIVSVMAVYCDIGFEVTVVRLQMFETKPLLNLTASLVLSQYAALTLTSCTFSTYLLLTKCVILN